MSFRTYKLKIKVKTWKRDSYGLYDYEATQCNNQTLTVNHSGQLNRVGPHVFYTDLPSKYDRKCKDTQNEGGSDESLLYAIESAEGIRIQGDATNEEDLNQLWTVIDRGLNLKGSALTAHDIIKLGRVTFKITQVKVANGDSKQNNRRSIIESIREHMQVAQDVGSITQHRESLTPTKKNSSSNAGLMCKICLYDKSEEENDPLISPCKCIGSVRYVHLKCMQNWVKSKLNMQQTKNILTILWKNLCCELCKEKLPITMNHRGEDLTLIPFDTKISGSYIMMESFSKERNSTGIHLIDLSENETFRIGRGHDCDLKISDISVSRVHAMLVVHKGNVYLKDNCSKFGTLLLRKGPLILNGDNQRSQLFQCGRSLLKFSLKKPWLAFVPCMSYLFTSQAPSERKNTGDFLNRNNDETRVRLASEDDDQIRDELRDELQDDELRND